MIPIDSMTVSFFWDGNELCAVLTESFTNIQECPCGFGFTHQEALTGLLADIG